MKFNDDAQWNSITGRVGKGNAVFYLVEEFSLLGWAFERGSQRLWEISARSDN